MEEPPIGLRERNRRWLENEIDLVAKRLFAERGYDATTIDDVAAAVGMSQRSIYRYFPTKEDIIFVRFDAITDDMLAALENRPLDEPLWISLRRMFDPFAIFDGPNEDRAVSRPILVMIFETPVLFASMLQRLFHIQERAAAIVRQRAERIGQPYRADDPIPHTLTASAIGCLIAAERSWLAGSSRRSIMDALDRAMATVAPSGSAADR